MIQPIPLASGERVKAALNNPVFLLQQVSMGEGVFGGGEWSAGASEAASPAAGDASASP